MFNDIPSMYFNVRVCSPPASFLHGILQIKTLEWMVILFSRESS